MSPGGDDRLVNFVVVGEVRSGTLVVQSGVDGRADAVCHADLFHEDVATRREAHEAYFGPSRGPQRLPEWFVEGEVSPWHYINRTVLDNPLRGERAVGLRLLYPVVRRWELYELFEERCREGDFCVVHVGRSPVACLVSLRQAQQSGVWSRTGAAPPEAYCPTPVRLEAAEVVEFCAAHLALRGKIRASCADVLEINYRDLFVDFQAVMRRVFDFLELPDSEEPAAASCRRLRNRPVPERVINWESLRRDLPAEYRALLDAEELF